MCKAIKALRNCQKTLSHYDTFLFKNSDFLRLNYYERNLELLTERGPHTRVNIPINTVFAYIQNALEVQITHNYVPRYIVRTKQCGGIAN